MIVWAVRLLSTVVILCGISYADSVQFYTSYSSWAAAAGGTIITPNISSVGIGGVISDASGTNFIGLVLPSDIPGVTEPDFVPIVTTPTLAWLALSDVACEPGIDCPFTLEMTLFFPQPTTAFAIELAPGSSYQGFLGAVFNSPQSEFTFNLNLTMPNSPLAVDTPAELLISNFSYVTPVPEPSAILLLGTGLAGMFGGVIRRKL